MQVVVAEGAPRFDGHLLARKLAEAGIQVTAIPDSAVFAMMARANKVGNQQGSCVNTLATLCVQHMHIMYTHLCPSHAVLC